MMVAGALAATSCSDFSDYNETPVDQTPSSSQTLWENILQNSDNLSDFAALVRQTGFDAELNTPRSLTVWAPKNGTFNPADYQGLSKEDLLRQFVEGHIAEYGHAATGKVNERVNMLNNKSFDFVGDGSYTFGGHAVTNPNMPSSNGLLHIIDGANRFYPNLYEYISPGRGIDLLAEYFKRYETTTLDPKASVEGPMVNGIRTYVDSVMITSNDLEERLRAQLSAEDSSYTMLLPTDKAYEEMYNRVLPYYNYLGTIKMHDVENYEKASDTKTKDYGPINTTYLADSLVRWQIVRNLVYSNTDGYNQWLVGKGEAGDTLRSTTRNKLSNPRDILGAAPVGEPIEMSNGYGRMVDSLAFYPWETYCPELSFSPLRYTASLFPDVSKMQRYKVTNPDNSPLTWLFGPETTLTEYTFGWIEAGGERTKPEVYISLPNVMSTTYNFYVVYMPVAIMSGTLNDPRPNWLNYQLQYCDAKGALQVYNFSKAYADSLLTGGTLPKVPTSVGTATGFINDPEKTDTVFIGRFTFPVSYRDLDVYPSLHITTPITPFNNQQLRDYSRDVRIATILLRPVELDEFEAKNK